MLKIFIHIFIPRLESADLPVGLGGLADKAHARLEQLNLMVRSKVGGLGRRRVCAVGGALLARTLR